MVRFCDFPAESPAREKDRRPYILYMIPIQYHPFDVFQAVFDTFSQGFRRKNVSVKQTNEMTTVTPSDNAGQSMLSPPASKALFHGKKKGISGKQSRTRFPLGKPAPADVFPRKRRSAPLPVSMRGSLRIAVLPRVPPIRDAGSGRLCRKRVCALFRRLPYHVRGAESTRFRPVFARKRLPGASFPAMSRFPEPLRPECRWERVFGAPGRFF